QGLDDEVRDDAAIARTHPRTVGVEDPHDARVETMRTVIRHGDRFGESFRLIVDAARPNWVDVPPVALALRVLEWIAIDFAGRREKEAGVLCFRDAERVVRSQRPDL